MVKGSERHGVTRCSTEQEGLYDRVLNMCVEEGKMCMHHMMAIDAAGGAAYMKKVGLNLPDDVCSVESATAWWPSWTSAIPRCCGTAISKDGGLEALRRVRRPLKETQLCLDKQRCPTIR